LAQFDHEGSKPFSTLIKTLHFLLQLYNTIPVEEEEPEEEKPKLTSKEIYSNLKRRLKSIKESCGQVCNTNIEDTEGKYYKFIEKKIDCDALFSNPDIDAEGEFPSPPRKIPKYL
jgi:hypothetical protein